MSSLTQSSYLCSLPTSKPSKNPTFFHRKIIKLKPIKLPSSAVCNSKDESNETEEQILEDSKPDRVKLALERARKYKKSLELGKNQEISVEPVDETARIVSENGGLVSKVEGIEDENKGLVSGEGDNGEKEIPEAVRRVMEKAKEYKKNKGVVGNDGSNMQRENLPEYGDGKREVVPDALRLAMEKAEEYDKNEGKLGDNKNDEESKQLLGDVKGGDMEVPAAVRMALAKANEYKKNKGIIDNNSSIVENSKQIGSEGGSATNLRSGSIEQNTENKGDIKISSIDFVGLNFADKKKGRGLPAGLVPVADPFSVHDLPEVEILVGDSSQFGNTASSESKTSSQEESSDLYKPKVTTWGMFPRPSDISKTYGGGRTIRPGEALETPEDRAAKQARTRELIAAYNRRMGLNMDPKLKAECEKALIDGDALMDVGRLKEALPYYETVMDKLAFQTKLHGLAALQWSICQDSLTRPEEARIMYEKLQSHPNVDVSKKARQFMFSFQAMEMMKVTRSSVPPKNTGYQSYFEAFVEDKADFASGSTDEKDDALNQAVLYVVFLASPILLVLLLVATKGSRF